MGSFGLVYLLIGFVLVILVCMFFARADINKKNEEHNRNEKVKDEANKISSRTLYVKPHHSVLRDEEIRVNTAKRFEEKKPTKQVDKDKEAFKERQKRAKELWGVKIEDPADLKAEDLW